MTDTDRVGFGVVSALKLFELLPQENKHIGEVLNAKVNSIVPSAAASARGEIIDQRQVVRELQSSLLKSRFISTPWRLSSTRHAPCSGDSGLRLHGKLPEPLLLRSPGNGLPPIDQRAPHRPALCRHPRFGGDQ